MFRSFNQSSICPGASFFGGGHAQHTVRPCRFTGVSAIGRLLPVGTALSGEFITSTWLLE